jgi:hypothetical protein
VNASDDRGTTPEPPKKPDSGETWLPPRLREKLDNPSTGDDFDFLKKKSSPIGPIITVVVILAIAGGALWMIRNNQKKAATARAAEEYAARLADSLAVVHRADSLAAVARADSIAFAALPKREQKRILAERAKQAAASQGMTSPVPATTSGGASTATGGASTAATGSSAGGAPPASGAPAAASGAEGSGGTTEPAAGEAAKPAGPFGIDAGQFLDEARAGEEAESLKTKTGLAASVLSLGEGDEVSYHVVLGRYSSRASAEAKANSLLSKGLVSQAAVLELPKAE